MGVLLINQVSNNAPGFSPGKRNCGAFACGPNPLWLVCAREKQLPRPRVAHDPALPPVMTLTANNKARAGICLLVVCLSAAGEVNPPAGVYPSGFSRAIKLGGELCDALPQKFADQLNPEVISLQPQDAPVVAPIATSAESKILRQVILSAGFIDVVNHICHAKAVDRIQPGFFDQYVKNLAQLNLGDASTPPPPIVEPRFWTDDVINDQLSYFNQMIGLVTAINLTHHYLGHFAKYSGRMTSGAGKLAPINNFLTPAEWDVSVKAGVLDALTCGLATEGPQALFDAISRMPVRPSWTAYIVPPQTDIPKLNKQLARYEDDFFHGKLN
jgi:hypothetical protein